MAMAVKIDANDGKRWTEMDVEVLRSALRYGDTIEEAIMEFKVREAQETANPKTKLPSL
jgi:hypothetical protein